MYLLETEDVEPIVMREEGLKALLGEDIILLHSMHGCSFLCSDVVHEEE
jgi:hypothetical protein